MSTNFCCQPHVSSILRVDQMKIMPKLGNSVGKKYRRLDYYTRDGAVVRALASDQCGPGSIPRLGVICGLSLLVLYSASRCFSLGTLVFPSPQKPTLILTLP